MKSFVKKFLLGLGVVLGIAAVLLLGYLGNYAVKNGPIGTGFTAKMLCSGVFVSNRDPGAVMREDLWIAKKYSIGAEVDYKEKSVTASIKGLFKRCAIFREGLGCTLILDTTEDELRKQAADWKQLPRDTAELPWPTGDLISEELPPGVDTEALNDVLDEAFSDPDPERPRRTRAVVVVYDGRIVAERYAPGFSPDTPLIGWSMTKSVTSALAGILVGKGKLSVRERAPVPEWSAPDDPRRAITLDHLLRMSSGLEFLEEYESNPSADCNVMLFTKRDMAAYAVDKPLEAEPGSKWSYSSGTTNIISRIVRDAVGGSTADYFGFPRRELFDKIGMQSAIMETDTSGTFVGSSHMYATARDWARFGLLYLQDGVWEGERILPEGWVEYTRTPTPHTPPEWPYGAQFWLNTGEKERWLASLPEDLYSARGHDGQYVTIIPSRKTVVVRLGLTPDHKFSWDHGSFITNILKALPE
ncbi:MAG: serine hydrolase [Deltaproteobacteria bacterium]|nr:MAG: serine hydrolase [Deltaproteobacteria bacterium]